MPRARLAAMIGPGTLLSPELNQLKEFGPRFRARAGTDGAAKLITAARRCATLRPTDLIHCRFRADRSRRIVAEHIRSWSSCIIACATTCKACPAFCWRHIWRRQAPKPGRSCKTRPPASPRSGPCSRFFISGVTAGSTQAPWCRNFARHSKRACSATANSRFR
jgi:hypothetical protein